MPYASEERWHTMLSESQAAGKPDLRLVAESSGELVGQAGLHPVGLAIRRRHVMVWASRSPVEARAGCGHVR
jgi:putative acetyltransferase